MPRITAACIEKITSANVIIELVKVYQSTQKPLQGKDFKTTDGIKLVLNTNKPTAYAYQEDKGYNCLSYLMEVQGKNYVDALTQIAELAGIILEHETVQINENVAVAPNGQTEITEPTPVKVAMAKPPRKKPYQRKQEFESYRDQTLAESGLTHKDQLATITRIEKGKKNDYEINMYESGFVKNFDYSKILPGDDLIIRYITLEGTEAMTRRVNKQGNAYGPEFPFIRVRHSNPNHHPDKNGKAKKYESPMGSGTFLYLPILLVLAYQQGRQIKTLYIHEGEKKADKACKHGHYSVGIGGITSIARGGVLPPEFDSIIKRCGVENVVFVVDSDYQDLGKSVNEPVDRRPMSFFYAVNNYRQYFYEFTNQQIFLNIYFGYISETGNDIPKGFDDLLVKYQGKEAEVIADINETLNAANGEGNYLNVHNITVINPTKLMQMFVFGSREKFFDFHYQTLKERVTFIYKKQKFRFVENPENDQEHFQLNQPLLEHEKFYTEETNEKSKVVKYGFEDEGLNIFLQNRGFHRYRDSNLTTVYVQVGSDKIVTEVDPEDIKDFVIDFTRENIKKRGVLNMLLRNRQTYLGKVALNGLSFVKPQLHKNSKETQHYYFLKNFVKITENGIEEIGYNQLTGYVWHENIIDREFTLLPPIFEAQNVKDKSFEFVVSEDAHECEFFDFLYKTSNFFHRKALLANIEKQEVYDHLINKLTAFGYLLHSYFNVTEARLIWAIDGKENQFSESNGRTGKTLLFTAVMQILNSVKVNGKKLDADNFAFEHVTERTKFVLIDDPRENIDFEGLFPMITGGFEANKKGKTKVNIPMDQTPKMAMAGNFVPKDNAPSFRARRWMLSFSDYFNPEYQPSDPAEYGHQFFHEWTEEQYNMFLNLAFRSVQLYLKIGLQKVPDNNLHQRSLRNQIGENFMTWAEEFYHRELKTAMSTAKRNRIGDRILRYEAMDHWSEWIERTTRTTKWIGSSHTFGKRIRLWAELNNYIFNAGIPKKDSKGLCESPNGGIDKSNGDEHFTLSEPLKV